MFDIAVTTEVWRADRLWWDGGTMRWFGVDSDVNDWLAGSCKTTAFWLLGLPEVTSGESYSIRYRTVVTQGGEVVTDTTMVHFDGLQYADVIAFQRWALTELSEMVRLFEAKHAGASITVPRRWVAQLWRLLKSSVAAPRPA